MSSFVLSERERAAWSQVELAKRMHMDVKTVRRIEASNAVWKKTLAALERAFNWEPGSARDVLTGGRPTPMTEPPQGDGPPWLVNGKLDLRDETERAIWGMVEVDEELRWVHIQRHRKK